MMIGAMGSHPTFFLAMEGGQRSAKPEPLSQLPFFLISPKGVSSVPSLRKHHHNLLAGRLAALGRLSANGRLNIAQIGVFGTGASFPNSTRRLINGPKTVHECKFLSRTRLIDPSLAKRYIAA